MLLPTVMKGDEIMNSRTTRLGSAEFMRQAFPWALLPTMVLFLITPSAGDAQVVTHITSSGLGTDVPLQPPSDGVYNITGGFRPGAGTGPILFHSFGDFSVGSGDIANFLNDTDYPPRTFLAVSQADTCPTSMAPFKPPASAMRIYFW